jgi:hypothetical protein
LSLICLLFSFRGASALIEELFDGIDLSIFARFYAFLLGVNDLIGLINLFCFSLGGVKSETPRYYSLGYSLREQTKFSSH